MTKALFEQIMSYSGLIGIWVVWYSLLKPQRVDRFRQRLFAIRDDLFDMAARGEISFDAPAYTRLRFLINGMIQYAHRISFPLLVVSMIVMTDAPKSSRLDWKQTLAGLPEGPRRKVLELHEAVSDAFAKQLIYGSVLLTLVFMGLSAISAMRLVKSKIAGRGGSRAISPADLRREVTKTTGTKVSVIEARVMYEEQWRSRINPLATA